MTGKNQSTRGKTWKTVAISIADDAWERTRSRSWEDG